MRVAWTLSIPVLATTLIAYASEDTLDPSIAAPATNSPDSYWTPERMRTAQPMPLGEDDGHSSEPPEVSTLPPDSSGRKAAPPSREN